MFVILSIPGEGIRLSSSLAVAQSRDESSHVFTDGHAERPCLPLALSLSDRRPSRGPSAGDGCLLRWADLLQDMVFSLLTKTPVMWQSGLGEAALPKLSDGRGLYSV